MSKEAIVKAWHKFQVEKHKARSIKKKIDNFELPYVDEYSYSHMDEHFGEVEAYERAKDELENLRSLLDAVVAKKVVLERYYRLLRHKLRETEGEAALADADHAVSCHRKMVKKGLDSLVR